MLKSWSNWRHWQCIKLKRILWGVGRPERWGISSSNMCFHELIRASTLPSNSPTWGDGCMAKYPSWHLLSVWTLEKAGKELALSVSIWPGRPLWIYKLSWWRGRITRRRSLSIVTFSSRGAILINMSMSIMAIVSLLFSRTSGVILIVLEDGISRPGRPWRFSRSRSDWDIANAQTGPSMHQD